MSDPEPMTTPVPPEPHVPEEPSFWAKLWAKAKPWLRKYVVAPIPILVVSVAAVILIVLGAKNIKIGGLIGKILGRGDPGERSVDTANSLVEDRVDAEGAPILVGVPDSRGITQAEVVAIETPGIFEDKSKIKVTPPGAEEPLEIALPDGVSAGSVETATVVKPSLDKVTVESTSTTSAGKVKSLVDKYKDRV